MRIFSQIKDRVFLSLLFFGLFGMMAYLFTGATSTLLEATMHAYTMVILLSAVDAIVKVIMLGDNSEDDLLAIESLLVPLKGLSVAALLSFGVTSGLLGVIFCTVLIAFSYVFHWYKLSKRFKETRQATPVWQK